MKKVMWWAVLVILCLSLLSSLAEEMEVQAVPEVTILASPATGTSPVTVSFSTNTTKTVTSYSWDFTNDGTSDSTEATPTFTYDEPGTYTAKVVLTTAENETLSATATIEVKPSPITVSLTANPTTGTAPLTVQFTAAAAGKEPLTYAWDFTGDGTPDSTKQNPLFTFETAGTYTTSLTVTDNENNKATKTAAITATAFDSQLSLTSYFPTTMTKGENQITVIVSNGGQQNLENVAGKIIAPGLQYLSSTTIGTLKVGDQDSLTIKVNAVEDGTINGTIKILDKVFPVSFTIAKQVEYNKDELTTQLTALQGQLQEQEAIYTEKKAEGYLVAEVFENIKVLKKQVQDAQEDLLTDKLQQAYVDINLASASLHDITTSLQSAKKQEVTFLAWLKENAIAITAIIAAFGAISGILIKAAQHAKSIGGKIGENVKQKIAKKKEHHEAGSEPHHEKEPEKSVSEEKKE